MSNTNAGIKIAITGHFFTPEGGLEVLHIAGYINEKLLPKEFTSSASYSMQRVAKFKFLVFTESQK